MVKQSQPSEPALRDWEQRQRDMQELAASKNDMANAIADHIGRLLDMEQQGQLRDAETMAVESFGIAEASQRARQPIQYEPGTDDEGRFVPDQVSWDAIGNLVEHDPEQARAIWLRIKDEARKELASGIRSAAALESGLASSVNPWQRARFLAIVDALRTDLQPRGQLEELLIQRMASTYELCLHWQREAREREELEEFRGNAVVKQEHPGMTERQKERQRWEFGYLPPRQAQAEAITDAYLMSERFERAFLRLVREFRNLRRTFNSLVVAGGVVNVTDGPQQVNIGTDPKE